MNCADFRRTGSAALDLCYVACSRQHAYLEQNLKPWDYSGATVILREAGGVITDWENKSHLILRIRIYWPVYPIPGNFTTPYKKIGLTQDLAFQMLANAKK